MHVSQPTCTTDTTALVTPTTNSQKYRDRDLCLTLPFPKPNEHAFRVIARDSVDWHVRVQLPSDDDDAMTSGWCRRAWVCLSIE